MVAVVEAGGYDRDTSAQKPDRDAMRNELDALIQKGAWTDQDIRRMNKLGAIVHGRFWTPWGVVDNNKT